MTDTYLEQVASATLNSLGAAVISLAPDVGQWWKPLLVFVSNQSGVPQQAFLFEGAPKMITLASFLRDSTFQAQGDVTSILAGTIVHAGQSVTVQFFAGMPGDVVTMQIVGISSNTPPPVGILPDVPGVRFSGAFAGLVNQVIYLDIGGGLALAANASQTFPTPSTAYYTGGVENIYVLFAINSGNMELTFMWFQDQQVTAEIAVDFVDNRFGAVTGNFEQTIPVKGPWLQVTAKASSAGPANAVILVSNNGGQPAIANNGGIDASLLVANDGFAVAAGAHIGIFTVGPYGGPVSVSGFTKDTTAFNWTMELIGVDFQGNLNPIWYADQRHVQQVDHIYLPPMPVRLDVTNGDSVSHNFALFVTRHPFYPW